MTLFVAAAMLALALVVVLDELIERGRLGWLVEVLDAPLRPEDDR